jgi:hypothetical protein
MGAHEMIFSPITPSEDEILHLGWPETGGVWMLRQASGNDL